MISEYNLKLNEYQIRNLIGLFDRAKEFDNGDWYGEIMNKLYDIVSTNMEVFEGQTNNFGDKIEETKK